MRVKKESTSGWVPGRYEQQKEKEKGRNPEDDEAASKTIQSSTPTTSTTLDKPSTTELPPHVHNPFRHQPLILNGHSDWVICVAFSPSNQLLASGSVDKTIQLWNPTSGAVVATLSGHSGTIDSLTFSPDGAILASSSHDKTIKLWNVASRTEVATLVGHEAAVFSAVFSPDGARLVSGSDDNTIRLWAVKSREIISILKGHSNSVCAVAFSPDGKRIASGSKDMSLRLWDAASGTTIARLGGHSGSVGTVAFSANGEHLASGSGDKTIRIWNAVTGTHIATLNGHAIHVRSIAFSPDSRYLASASYDATIRLWNMVSKAHISTLKDHSKSVWSVTFSHDGTRLASGSEDNTVRVWSSSLEEPRDDVVLTSHSHGSTHSTTQDVITPAATSVSSHNDSVELSSLDTWTTTSQQDAALPASTLVPLSNDITGSISLKSSTPIASGGFGELFLGVHTDHGKVALKKPRRLLDEALARRFLREIDLWCSVSHQCILPCLGMCKIGPDVYVVSPFIENGDLLSCMTRGKELDRIKLLYEVAEALAHLHHRGIVHGDVKAQNVLLADNGSALLCDFGLAKAFDTMATSTEAKGAGSVRWMAPELFHGESRSMASDVYSLGITIAEVLSGRAPYHGIFDTLAVMFHVVYKDERPPKDPLSSPEGKSYATLWETAEKCWVKDVKARPYMAQVLGMLFPLTRERA